MRYPRHRSLKAQLKCEFQGRKRPAFLGRLPPLRAAATRVPLSLQRMAEEVLLLLLVALGRVTSAYSSVLNIPLLALFR